MTEVEKLHGLHNTGMTMDERFTLLAQQAVFRRGKTNPLRGRAPRARGNGRTNSTLIEAIVQQLNQAQRPNPDIPFASRGRGRGNLRRYGSEGSVRSMPGLRRERSNSFGFVNQSSKDQRWRRSNSNLSNYAGSVNGSVRSVQSAPRGYWLRGDVTPRRARGGPRGRGRGRELRGRVHLGRVNRMTEPAEGRPARGSGRRGARRSAAPAARGQARGRARGWGPARGRARGRGRGGPLRSQTPKPVPTKAELDAQLDQYMMGTKAALDKELDEYMRHAMDFE